MVSVRVPVVEQLRFQLVDPSLQRRHPAGLRLQVLHLTQAAEQRLSGLFHLPPHPRLLPLQGPVAVLQSSHGLLGAPQLLLQSLVTQHGFLHLLVPGALQELQLLDDALHAPQAAVGAVHLVGFLGSDETAFVWFVFGVTLPQPHLERRILVGVMISELNKSDSICVYVV